MPELIMFDRNQWKNLIDALGRIAAALEKIAGATGYSATATADDIGHTE